MSPDFDIAVIGGGGAGLVSAISAAQSEKSVLLLEKTSDIGGHTANTQGMFPASYTRFQKASGILDSPEKMTMDILNENGNSVPYEVVNNLSLNSRYVAEWLVDFCGQELEVATDFKYHGYSNYRIHSPPSRTGRELIITLLRKAESMRNIEIIKEHGVSKLIHNGMGIVSGLEISGSGENITTGATIITTGGYGANRDFVEKYMPDAAKMMYFGSSEHCGDSIKWGKDLNAELDYLDSYQAHSAVSSVGTLITWETVMKGALIINSLGERFANEITGYSKFAKFITNQPGSIAYEIYNREIHEEMLQRYPEYKKTYLLGGIKSFYDIKEVASFIGCNTEKLASTIYLANSHKDEMKTDEFGRDFFVTMEAPYYVAKITPALFHTQGGLRVGSDARVILKDGLRCRNVFAAGDAAAGISGPGPDGYVSGSGLLCALTYGWLAGKSSSALK